MRHAGRLTERERLRLLAAYDAMMKHPPTRPQAEADREIAEVRRSRRTGW